MARIVYDVLVEEEFKAAVLARFLGTSTNSVQATGLENTVRRQIGPAFSAGPRSDQSGPQSSAPHNNAAETPALTLVGCRTAE